MATYPKTKEVIDNLLNESEFKERFPKGEEIINITKNWKRKTWKKVKEFDDNTKNLEIARLILKIAEKLKERETSGLNIKLNNDFTDLMFKRKESTSYYKPEDELIVLCGKPSIITGLHELSHYLFGPNELIACTFSISLFKITFPKAFEKLNWEGHMLKT